MAKDYYKILGVKKTDSKETIKKAYRDAVKRLHPDVNQGRFDKKRFYEIQEAYETLGDEEKRRLYDRDRSEETKSPINPREPFFGESPSWWSELYEWLERWHEPLSRRKSHSHVEITLSRAEAWEGGNITLPFPISSPCPFCGGEGTVELFPCPMCGGVGQITEHLSVQISIPPRVADGTILKVPIPRRTGTLHTLVVLVRVDWRM